jgi:hypothetical protein
MRLPIGRPRPVHHFWIQDPDTDRGLPIGPQGLFYGDIDKL